MSSPPIYRHFYLPTHLKMIVIGSFSGELRVFLNYGRNTGVNGGFGEVVELVLPARPYPVV